MPPDLALLSTLIGSNCPCLELIFMVPKVFEPLKFDCRAMILFFYLFLPIWKFQRKGKVGRKPTVNRNSNQKGQVRNSFSYMYFPKKTYVVTPHYNFLCKKHRLSETVLMKVPTCLCINMGTHNQTYLSCPLLFGGGTGEISDLLIYHP